MLFDEEEADTAPAVPEAAAAEAAVASLLDADDTVDGVGGAVDGRDPRGTAGGGTARAMVSGAGGGCDAATASSAARKAARLGSISVETCAYRSKANTHAHSRLAAARQVTLKLDDALFILSGVKASTLADTKDSSAVRIDPVTASLGNCGDNT